MEDFPSIAEDDSTPKQEITSFEISYSDKPIPCQRFNPSANSPDLIFTHGAGGTLNAAAMVNFAAGFAASKPLLYFQGSMNVKSRTKLFHAVIENQGWSGALGGRSMGARAAVMASHDDADVKALVLVSYPLKSEKGDVRDQILLDLREDVDVLFISGDQDSMCDLGELENVRRKMKATTWLIIVDGAGHGMGLKPKKATDVVGRLTGELAAKWLDERDKTWEESTIGWNRENSTTFQSSWSVRQENGSSTARDGDAKSAVKDGKESAESSNGRSKVTAERTVEKKAARSRKRGSKAQTAVDTPETRDTRSKKRK